MRDGSTIRVTKKGSGGGPIGKAKAAGSASAGVLPRGGALSRSAAKKELRGG